MNPEGQVRNGPRAWGPGRRGKLITSNPKLKLLDQVREVIRLKHYSLRTERCDCDWLRRYIHFPAMGSREALFLEPEAKMESFLSDWAVQGHVAASAQNQAFNALRFLYREMLHRPLENIQAVRTDRPVRVPTVLTVEEEQRTSNIEHLISNLEPQRPSSTLEVRR